MNNNDMNNNDFYVENSEMSLKNKVSFNKKTFIIGLAVIVLLVVIYLFVNGIKNNSFSIEIKNPSIMYIDEPLDIPVTISGPKNKLNELTTAYFSESDEIIELLDNEFYGKNGSILIKPVSLGREHIVISSSIGVDKSSKEVLNKTIDITVCPKFDDTLVENKNITVKQGKTEKLIINFGEAACSEIITYDSQDENIASVDIEGTILGKSIGTTKVVVSNGSNAIVLNVNVIS